MESHGSAIPEITQEACRKADAVLFGATWKHCRTVLRFLRWGLDTYANVRPARSRTSARAIGRADGVDLVVVRENTEGEAPAREGDLAELARRWPELRDALGRSLPSTGAFAIRVTTEEACARIARAAARQAIERKTRGRPGRVTIVTKSNVLARTDGMLVEIASRILSEAGVETDQLYIDEACRRLVTSPQSFDVVLTPNLFGDIMSSIAAELVGGIGVAPTACIGDRHAYFEPLHGAAPDIAGKGVANPIATILSAQMMLAHLGLGDTAARLERAVSRLLEEGEHLTPDLGGSACTDEVAAEIIRLFSRDGEYS